MLINSSKQIWQTVILQPGYFGKQRAKRYQEFDSLYGAKQWRIAWQTPAQNLDFLGMTTLYEESYYRFLLEHPDYLEQLVMEASEVFDDAPSNIGSGFDYLLQETDRTHVQDISIRRVVLRLGHHFQGSSPIQIRDHKGQHPLSLLLSPGRVPFCFPTWIQNPELSGWWEAGSVESFYQSNKIVQILE